MMKTRPSRRLLSQLFLAALLLLLVLSFSSCAVLEVGFVDTPEPLYGLTATVSALSTQNTHLAGILLEATRQAEGGRPMPPPTSAFSPTPGPSPTPTPTPSPPRFSNLRFSTQADAAQSRRFFAAEIPRLYAVWDYENMREGMVVRRIWRHLGEDWIVRDEAWNFSILGPQGTMQGISIFDLEEGLQPGEYSLSLYIDGAAQDVDPAPGMQDRLAFWLFPPEVTEPVSAPDRSRAAFVESGGILKIEEPDGSLPTLAILQEISALAWFPDSRTLLFVERDRTEQVAADSDAGLTHKIWIVDVISGERSLLSGAGENFHSPLLSPGGRYLSVLTGPTALDVEECQASPALLIVELDVEFRRSALFSLTDFEGLPNPTGAFPDLELRAPRWEAENRLSLGLRWPCPAQGSPAQAVYRLNLWDRQAVRVE